MDPTARSRLAAAARRYLTAAPWTAVRDDYAFGLHDRTSGQFGCASILGAGGMEFGLTIALGAHGFALMQKLLDNEVDDSTMLAESSSVALSITNVARASRAYQRAKRLFVDTSKVKSPTRGYLTGWRLVPGRSPGPLDTEGALFLARCLEAVAELAETGRLGTDEVRDGARTLFFNLTEEAGELRIRQSYRLLEEVDVYPTVELPAAVLEELKQLPRVDACYKATLFTPPVTVKGGTLWTGLLLDEEGQALAAPVAPNFGEAALGIFQAFKGKASGPHRGVVGVPTEVWTDSPAAFASLQDGMQALGVQFVFQEVLPELTAAKESLGGFLTR